MIVKEVLLVSIQGKVKRRIWRMWILIKGCERLWKNLINLHSISCSNKDTCILLANHLPKVCPWCFSLPCKHYLIQLQLAVKHNYARFKKILTVSTEPTKMHPCKEKRWLIINWEFVRDVIPFPLNINPVQFSRKTKQRLAWIKYQLFPMVSHWSNKDETL